MQRSTFFSNKNIRSNDAIKIKRNNITINNEERPAADDDFVICRNA